MCIRSVSLIEGVAEFYVMVVIKHAVDEISSVAEPILECFGIGVDGVVNAADPYMRKVYNDNVTVVI